MGIFPDRFVAFFYSGLGCALALAGVLVAGILFFAYAGGSSLFVLYGILTFTLCKKKVGET